MNYHVVIQYIGNREEIVTSESETIIKSSSVNTVWQNRVEAPNQEIAFDAALFNFEHAVLLTKPMIVSITVTAEDEVLEVASAN